MGRDWDPIGSRADPADFVRATDPSSLHILDRMRVAFVPVWAENPYHAELEKALRSLGIEVLRPQSLKSLCRNYRAGVEKVDLVHVHALPQFSWSLIALRGFVAFYQRLLWLRIMGVRLVWTMHNLDNHESQHRWIESLVARYLAPQMEGIIVHGKSAKQIVESRWNQRKGIPFHVIPHGHYINSYKNEISAEAARAHFGFSASNLVFLFLGKIRPYKGVVGMVHAFRLHTEPNARLIITGMPMNQEICNEVAHSIEGDSRIRFLPGHVADDDIQLYMNACDVVVLPYRRILTSGAAVLAMSFGKPCIAPRAGCVTDMLEEKGAIFFDPAVNGDLERALQKAIDFRHRLREMGLYNLRRAAVWDWESIGRSTAAVYKQCFPNECVPNFANGPDVLSADGRARNSPLRS
jgi:beta-1,4-mannosyltransferase